MTFIVTSKKTSIFVKDDCDNSNSYIHCLSSKIKQIYLKNFFSDNKLQMCRSIFYESNVEILDIPKSIKYIQYNKNNDICNILPWNLYGLVLGGLYNKHVNNLPQELVELSLGHEFNQYIDNLPHKLYILHLGYNFNHSVESLPESLKIIEFSGNFTHNLSNFPNELSLIVLNFSYYDEIYINSLKKVLKNKKIVDRKTFEKKGIFA